MALVHELSRKLAEFACRATLRGTRLPKERYVTSLPQARAKTPKDNALYRKVIPVPHDGRQAARTLRIATYPPRGEQTEPAVTFGIGYDDPEKFAKIFFEVTEDNWKVVQAAVRAAFEAKKTGVPKTARRARAAE